MFHSFALYISFILRSTTIPVHLLIIITLIRYRNVAMFKKPFFQFLLSLSISDCLACLFLSVFDTNAIINGMCFNVVCGTYLVIVYDGFFEGNQVALLLIAINRFFAVCFPFWAAFSWKPIYTKVGVAFQWTVFTMAIVGHVVPSGRMFMYSLTNTTDLSGSYLLSYTETQSTWPLVYDTTKSIIDMASGLLLIVLYTILVIKGLKRKLTHNNNTRENEGFATEFRLTLQGFLLSTAALVQAGLLCAIYVLEMEVTLNEVAIYRMAMEMNFYTGPWIAIAMSSELRKYIRKLIGNKVEDKNKRNGNVKKNLNRQAKLAWQENK